MCPCLICVWSGRLFLPCNRVPWRFALVTAFIPCFFIFSLYRLFLFIYSSSSFSLCPLFHYLRRTFIDNCSYFTYSNYSKKNFSRLNSRRVIRSQYYSDYFLSTGSKSRIPIVNFTSVQLISYYFMSGETNNLIIPLLYSPSSAPPLFSSPPLITSHLLPPLLIFPPSPKFP